jgi:hypothetical protein
MATLIAGWTMVASAARVDIEGESFEACRPTPKLEAKVNPLLSGGRQLNLRGPEPFQIRYEFTAPEAGEYTLVVKEYYRNGASPIRWRVDNGPWTTVKQSWGLTMSELYTDDTFNEWGRAQLAPGRHTLEIESIGPVWRNPPDKSQADGWTMLTMTEPSDQYVIAIDKLILSTEPIIGPAEWAKLFAAKHEPANPSDWFLPDWGLDTGAPSILDEIALTPKPIGNGPEFHIKRDGDRFVRADGTPFRVWGMSVPTAPPRAEAEYYAKRARRLGINVARIHSLDGDLCDRNVGRNYVFDPERLDRLEYFIACLKREGIYVMLDVLYNWQFPMIGPDCGLPAGVTLPGRVRIPFYFDAGLQKYNREFIAKILNCKNPYTGLRNADDPAIAFFQIINENSMFFQDTGGKSLSDYHKQMLGRQLSEWLLKKYGSREKLAAAWGSALKPHEDPAVGSIQFLGNFATGNARNKNAFFRQRVADETHFTYDVMVKFHQQVRDFVRNELGAKHILVHGCGWWGNGWLDTLDIAANLPGMDFFDNHSYWNITSGVLAPADADEKRKKGGSMIEYFASRAPEGYPWMASEWNNQFKLEGPMTMASYGALHGWDAMFQYRMDGFDGARIRGKVAPPQIYLQYPLASFAFRSGAIKESDVVWRHVIPDDRLFDCTRTESPHSKPLTGIQAILGKCVLRYGAGEPFQIDPARYARDGVVESATGELIWRAQPGVLHIKAARLQGLVGQADGKPVALGAVTLTITPDPVSVAVAAVDGQPLASSKRMFLSAVGENKTAEEIANPNPQKKAGRGGQPLLLKPVVGDVTFAQPVKAVYALDLSGARKAEVPLTNGGKTFHFDNRYRTTWFEVVRKDGHGQ